MSGLAFDAMRTTPPPPQYCDTEGINPLDYISVQSRDGQTFVVHRACFCVSPLIRRAFARRKSVQLTDIAISFDKQWQDESYGSSGANHINTYYNKNKMSFDVNNYSRNDDVMRNVTNSFTQSNLTRDNMTREYSAKTPSRLANSANSNESLSRTAPLEFNTTPSSNTTITMKPEETSNMREQAQESSNWNNNEVDEMSNNANTSRVNVLSANSAARYSAGWSTTAPSSVSGETEPPRDSEVKFGNNYYYDDNDNDNDNDNHQLDNDAKHIIHNTHKHTSPVTLTDTPLHDRTVQIYFPITSGATLETVISYMYYKLRYDGHPELERPELQIPIASAIEIMKLAHTL